MSVAAPHLVCCRESLGPLPPFAGGVGHVVPQNWSARHEPRFESQWLTYLVLHPLQWCHASDLWAAADAWQRTELRQRSHEVVVKARRLGMVIEADPVLGYRLTGYEDLPRYLHLHPTADEEGPGPLDGQLTIDQDCGVW